MARAKVESFRQSLESIAQRKPITSPVQVTLDPCAWVMLQTKARAKGVSLDQIVSEMIQEEQESYSDYINPDWNEKAA